MFFFTTYLSTILCIALNEFLEICAIGRQNGTIELWSLKNPHYIIRTLSGNKELQLRKIVWFSFDKNRLISVGLSGDIIGWNWKIGGDSLFKIFSNGGPIWDVIEIRNRKQLCIACDDGTVRINDLKDKAESIHQDVLPCGSGRNLSICLSTDELYISIGTSESKIFIFNLRTKQNIEKINLHKQNRKDVCIWTLENINNLQFASGNSLGGVSIWDWILGTSIASFCVSYVPILTLTLFTTESNLLLFAAGSEGKVQELICGELEHDWSMGKWIRPHKHDITSMVVNQYELWTGSNDGCFSLICPKTLKIFGKIFPFYVYPPQILQKQKQVVILDWDFSKIRVWHVNDFPKLSYVISPNMKRTLTSCAINKTGHFVIATDQINIKAWSLKEKKISRLHVTNISGCISINFNELKSNILLINYNNFAEIIDCSVPMILGKFVFQKGNIATWVNKWIVIRTELDIILYNPKTQDPIWRFPKFLNPPRQVFLYQEDQLFFLYNDNLFRFFDVKKKCLTTWSKENESIISLLPQYKHLESITHCSLNDKYLLLNAQDWFVVGDIQKHLNFKSRTLKRRKLKGKSIAESIQSCWDRNKKYFVENEKYNNFSFNSKFHPLLGSSFIKKDIYLLSIDWEQCLVTLPLPIYKRKFGT